jgi:hypothetical protein
MSSGTNKQRYQLAGTLNKKHIKFTKRLVKELEYQLKSTDVLGHQSNPQILKYFLCNLTYFVKLSIRICLDLWHQHVQ